MNSKRVIVGMSGGVDSSVAALLLKQQGYAVEGLFMKNWEEDEGEPSNCSADQDLLDAQTICLKLGIRLHTVNFSREYWDNVFTYFLDTYQSGATPNPDVLCNTQIKFKAFLDHALALGADFIATGHFVRCRKKETEFQLLKGMDADKDQSYFLHGLNQYQLSKALFPVGNLTKTEVRRIAKEHEFQNWAKKDSTGICFIGERKFKTFLEHYLPAQPGNIETEQGKIIGKHDGLMFYTIGQRQGLGIGGKKNAIEAPWYVLEKDLNRNVLMVGQGHDHPKLFSPQLTAKHLSWISGNAPPLPFLCTAKIRYRQKDQECTISMQSVKTNRDLSLLVTFKNPQRAITPGQFVVFYDGEICLGGGAIDAKRYHYD
ncbi:MAG: tRNA 2-thiouridine(34) synthase MnmA [Gammaproteobacteria bacterium]|nr:tRNA 2-thiouridine(34) synthase MnmA [Gammaproteobacteria bacterium]